MFLARESLDGQTGPLAAEKANVASEASRGDQWSRRLGPDSLENVSLLVNSNGSARPCAIYEYFIRFNTISETQQMAARHEAARAELSRRRAAQKLPTLQSEQHSVEINDISLV